jgi:4-amino-4-deoxy-L-arabinose transferase-like glycosyltransferase
MGSIDSEGAEYARIAENLLNGNGYVGIAIPGTELMFPPLFPFLIAAVSLLTHQAEIAGRLISVTMGTLIILPVFYIALHLYNRTVAYVAAVLVACHPLLVGFASTVFIETTYMTLVLSGAYWSLRCLSLQMARTFLLAGVFFGLAYLTRPEAALYPFLTIFLLVASSFVMNRQQTRQVALCSCVLLAAFLILATPYIVWLSTETGQFRWEGKAPINLALSMPFITGINSNAAEYGISADLEESGFANRSNFSVITATQFRFRDIIRVVIFNGPRNFRRLMSEVSGGGFLGSPILFVLAILGLFKEPWSHKSIISQIYLLIVVLGVASLSLSLVPVCCLYSRYLLLFLPVMIIWAANGVVLLFQWAYATMRLAGSGAPTARKAGMAVGLTSCAMLVMIAFYGIRHVPELTLFDYTSRPVKQAGRWLDALAPGPKTIMDASTVLAFHAGASFVGFPYTDASLALKYIEKKRVDFIVLREDSLPSATYSKDWLESGIPDRRAQLIYSDKAQRGRILIYKWN